MKFEVTILGSSSATPIYNRNPSAQLININDYVLLVDCGEGTQLQMLKFGHKLNKIDCILISHLHGDHFFGLVGLLSSMNLNGRVKALNLYCHKPLKEIIDIQFLHSDTILKYPLNYHFYGESKIDEIINHPNFTVNYISLNHRIPCVGFIIKQKRTLPKIDIEKATRLNIPTQYYSLLKKGINFTDKYGITHEAASLTVPANDPKSYAYISDTLCDIENLKYLNDIDVLYHEATFLHDKLERAEQTFHTTAKQAAQFAESLQVKKLLLGHFSARYKDIQVILEEAKEIFSASFLAIEGKTFKI